MLSKTWMTLKNVICVQPHPFPAKIMPRFDYQAWAIQRSGNNCGEISIVRVTSDYRMITPGKHRYQSIVDQERGTWRSETRATPLPRYT